MSGHFILAIIQDEFDKRGSFPVAEQREIARVIKARVDAMRSVTPERQSESAVASWYEREPGEDDA